MDTIHQILSWAGMTGIILAVVISAYLAFVRHEHTSDISVRLNGILMALSTVLFVAGRLHGTSQSATVLWWIAIALVAVSIVLLVIARATGRRRRAFGSYSSCTSWRWPSCCSACSEGKATPPIITAPAQIVMRICSTMLKSHAPLMGLYAEDGR